MEIEIMRDGLRLHGQFDGWTGKKFPVAILLHGFGGDLGYEKGCLYQKITDRLHAVGVGVIRFDFNGHGKSDGKFCRMDVLNEIEDGIEILEYVRSLDQVTDIYLIGHSQGGVIGSMLAGYYADVIKKLVLLAPATTLKDDAVKGKCMGTAYDSAHIPPVVYLENGGHEVGGHYFRIAKWLPIYETAKAYEGPALCIHGEADEVVPVRASIQYGESMKNCRTVILDKLDHGIEGEDQETALNMIQDFLKDQ